MILFFVFSKLKLGYVYFGTFSNIPYKVYILRMSIFLYIVLYVTQNFLENIPQVYEITSSDITRYFLFFESVPQVQYIVRQSWYLLHYRIPLSFRLYWIPVEDLYKPSFPPLCINYSEAAFCCSSIWRTKYGYIRDKVQYYSHIYLPY